MSWISCHKKSLFNQTPFYGRNSTLSVYFWVSLPGLMTCSSSLKSKLLFLLLGLRLPSLMIRVKMCLLWVVLNSMRFYTQISARESDNLIPHVLEEYMSHKYINIIFRALKAWKHIWICKTTLFVLTFWTLDFAFWGYLLLYKIKTSSSYKLLMPLQLSIFSFVRSQEIQFFFCKCIWSLELLTFRDFCKEKTDSALNPDFFNTLLRTSSSKQRLNQCTSISVSSSGNPSRPFSSSSSPAFCPPSAVLPWGWGFSLRM